MPSTYSQKFLEEQQRSTSEKFEQISKVLPANGKLITVAEGKVVVMMLHIIEIGLLRNNNNNTKHNTHTGFSHSHHSH